MKKINFKKIGEVLYEEDLPNSLKVIYYPTCKTKNFYITISTNYGANVIKYIKNGKKIDVIPGTAHFLEHKIMDFTKNKKSMNLINGLGSLPNAYTMYDITNYNIFGSTDIKKNLKLLLDCVFKANISESDVKKEIGIISEEIDMENDDTEYLITEKSIENTFIKDKTISYPILGTKESIKQMNAKYLTSIYKDFYTFDRMHIIVTGHFDVLEISNYINDYFKSTTKPNKNIKIPKIKEPPEVLKDNVIIKNSLSKDKVGILYKIPIVKIKGISKRNYQTYFDIIISVLFGSSSIIIDKFKEKNITNFTYYTVKNNKYNILFLKANTKNDKLFINIIKNTIKSINISKKDFEIKIKLLISSLILNYEDIISLEDVLTNQIKTDGRILTNLRKELENLTYKDLSKVTKSLNFNNYLISKIVN